MGEVATEGLQLGQRALAPQPGEPLGRQTLHHLEGGGDGGGQESGVTPGPLRPLWHTVRVLLSHLLALLDVVLPGVGGLQRREDVSVQGAVQSQVLQAGQGQDAIPHQDVAQQLQPKGTVTTGRRKPAK